MAHPLGPTRDQIRTVDPVLSGMVNARMNADADFIGDRAFPPLYEEGRVSGQVSLLNTGMASAGNIEIDRGSGSRYAEVGFVPSFLAFACREYGVMVAIDDELRSQSQVGLDLNELAAIRAGHEVQIQRELRLVNAFFGTGDWTNEATLGAAAQWDDAGGTPLANIWTGKRAVKINSGVEANAAIIGWDGFRVAVQNGDITALVPADSRQSQITLTALQARLAEAFELASLFVGRAVRNTANLLAAETFAFIWVDNLLIFRHEPAGSVNAAAAAQFASTAGGAPPVTDRWFDDDIRSQKVRVRETRDELVIDALKGHLTLDLAN